MNLLSKYAKPHHVGTPPFHFTGSLIDLSLIKQFQSILVSINVWAKVNYCAPSINDPVFIECIISSFFWCFTLGPKMQKLVWKKKKHFFWKLGKKFHHQFFFNLKFFYCCLWILQTEKQLGNEFSVEKLAKPKPKLI